MMMRTARPSLGTAEHGFGPGVYLCRFWNYSGFDCISTCAGEIKDPANSVPRGLFIALALIVISTMLPLLVAVGVNKPHWQNWHDGSWCAALHFTVAPLGS